MTSAQVPDTQDTVSRAILEELSIKAAFGPSAELGTDSDLKSHLGQVFLVGYGGLWDSPQEA